MSCSFAGCSLLFDSPAERGAYDAGAGIDGAALLDAGGIELGPLENITFGSADSTGAVVVWDDTEYRVVWQQKTASGSEIYAATMDTATPVLLAAAAASNSGVTAAWTEAALAVAWLDDSVTGLADLHFGLVDADNALEGDVEASVDVAGISAQPSIAPTGTQIGLVWTQFVGAGAETYLRRFDGQGAAVELPLAVGIEAVNPSLAFNGSLYGLVWQGLNPDGQANIFFRSFGAASSTFNAVLPLSDSTLGALAPAIATGDANFGVVWHELTDTNEAVFFCGVSAGLEVGRPVRLSSSEYVATSPAIVWNGNGFGVAWQQRLGEQFEIVFQELDALGAPLGAPQQLSAGSGNSLGVSLAENGTSYAATWQKGAVGTRLIQFREFSL